MNYLLILFLSGTFSGTGEALFKSGKKLHCDEIFLNIKTKENAFYMNEGGYSCSSLQASFDNFKMTIQDGKLLDGTKEMGSISESELDYKIYDEEDGSTYHLNLKKISSSSITYFEEWHNGREIALKISGKLKKN